MLYGLSTALLVEMKDYGIKCILVYNNGFYKSDQSSI